MIANPTQLVLGYLGALKALNAGVQGDSIQAFNLATGLNSLRDVLGQAGISHTIPRSLPHDAQGLKKIIMGDVGGLLVRSGETVPQALARITKTDPSAFEKYIPSGTPADPLHQLRRIISPLAGPARRSFFAAVKPHAPAGSPALPEKPIAAMLPPMKSQAIAFHGAERLTPIPAPTIPLPTTDVSDDGFLTIILPGADGKDTLVRSPYKIVSHLGTGGMADVYLAEDTSRGCELVAIKKVRPENANKSILKIFEDEQGIQAKIKDKSRLVQTYFAGRTALNLPFIVVKLMPGGDLEGYINQIRIGHYLRSLKKIPSPDNDAMEQKAGLESMISITREIDAIEAKQEKTDADNARLAGLRTAFRELRDAISVTKNSGIKRFDGQLWDLETMMDIGSEVIAGIAALHEANLVHRDIKPENTLLPSAHPNNPIEPYTSDLGGTAAKGEIHPVFGTPQYMSPESYFDDCPADPRRDVFALGSVLWELMTLSRLFRESTSPQQFMAESLHVGNDGRKPSQDAPRHHIPPIIDDIILKCIQQKPENRFASAQELLIKWVTSLGDQCFFEALSLQDPTEQRIKVEEAIRHYSKAVQRYPFPEVKEKLVNAAMHIWRMADEVGDILTMNTMAVFIDTHDTPNGIHRTRIHQPVKYKIEFDGLIPEGSVPVISIKTHKKTFVDGKIVVHQEGTVQAVSLDEEISLSPGEVRTLSVEFLDPTTNQYIAHPISIPLNVRSQENGSAHEVRVPVYSLVFSPGEAYAPEGTIIIPAGRAIILNEGDGRTLFGKIDTNSLDQGGHRVRAVDHDFAVAPKITNAQCLEWLQDLALQVQNGSLEREALFSKIPLHWNGRIKEALTEMVDGKRDFISIDDIELKRIVRRRIRGSTSGAYEEYERALKWNEAVTHMEYDDGLELMRFFYGEDCRYPTAPEWTIAAVGSDSLRRFPWGDSDNPTGKEKPAPGSFAGQLGHFAPDGIPENPILGGVHVWDTSPYSPQDSFGNYIARVAFLVSGTKVYLDNFHPRYFFKLGVDIASLMADADAFDRLKVLHRLVAGRPFTDAPSRRDVLDYAEDADDNIGLVPVIPLRKVKMAGSP